MRTCEPFEYTALAGGCELRTFFEIIEIGGLRRANLLLENIRGIAANSVNCKHGDRCREYMC